MCRIVDNGAENIENLEALRLRDVQRSRFPPAAIARQEVPPCDSSGAGSVGRAAVSLPGREAFPDATDAIQRDPTAKPLCIDLFCGLGGWTDGFLAEGYRVVGFDIEHHRYPERILPETDGIKITTAGVDFNNRAGTSRERSFNYANQCAVREAPLTGRWTEYPGELVIQDVLTIHGSQFRDAAVIVASPPCQRYSYLAMPWSRSKPEVCKSCGGKGKYPKIAEALAMEEIPCIRCGGRGTIEHSQAAKALRREWETNGPDNRLFDACFRIQREAIAAAGRYIPLIVENVRGAQPWVGRSAWNYGSFHLWGDVPALMPINLRPRGGKCDPRGYESNGGSWFGISMSDARAGREMTSKTGQKVPGFRFDGSGRSFQTASVDHAKSDRESGGWFNDYKTDKCVGISRTGSKSNARKMASAQIAKIPFELARHVAQVYYPNSLEQAAGGPRRMGKTQCR